MKFSRAENGVPVVDGKEVPEVPGRLLGTLNVQDEDTIAVTATSLQFYWVKEHPYFFSARKGRKNRDGVDSHR